MHWKKQCTVDEGNLIFRPVSQNLPRVASRLLRCNYHTLPTLINSNALYVHYWQSTMYTVYNLIIITCILQSYSAQQSTAMTAQLWLSEKLYTAITNMNTNCNALLSETCCTAHCEQHNTAQLTAHSAMLTRRQKRERERGVGGQKAN